MRRLLVAGALAVMLLLGLLVGAWADVPDTQPAAPDPAHVLWFCVINDQYRAYRTVYALDDSQGECPGPSWIKVPVVVAIPG